MLLTSKKFSEQKLEIGRRKASKLGIHYAKSRVFRNWPHKRWYSSISSERARSQQQTHGHTNVRTSQLIRRIVWQRWLNCRQDHLILRTDPWGHLENSDHQRKPRSLEVLKADVMSRTLDDMLRHPALRPHVCVSCALMALYISSYLTKC